MDSSDLANRDEVAKVLTNLIRDPDFPPAYKVNAITAYNRMQGHDMPTRSQVEVRTVPASVSAWLDTVDVTAIDVTPEPAELSAHVPRGTLPPPHVGAPTSSAPLTPGTDVASGNQRASDGEEPKP